MTYEQKYQTTITTALPVDPRGPLLHTQAPPPYFDRISKQTLFHYKTLYI